jgi:hypothetical protein
MKQHLKQIAATLFIISIGCYACNDTTSTTTTTEEKTEIRTMDSSSKVVEQNTNKLEEQTKKVEESLEKVDKENDSAQ